MKNIRKIYDYIDCKDRFHRLYKNEKGSALLIAMIMIVVLLIIGTATMNTSTTEVMISGNYRLMKEEFYKAEGPLEYAQSQSTSIYSTIGITVGNSIAIPLAADNANSAILNKNVFSDVAAGSNVALRRIGNSPPRSSGTQAMKFKSLHYIIDVTGRGPANAESHQIMEVVRYLPEG